MSKEDNLAATKRFGEAVNKGDFAVFKQVMAPNIRDHDPAPDQGPGPEGFVKFFTKFRGAFPDLAVAVEHQVVDDDNIAFGYTVTGTHKGDFMGVPATGKRIKARGCRSRVSRTAKWSSAGAARTSSVF